MGTEIDDVIIGEMPAVGQLLDHAFGTKIGTKLFRTLGLGMDIVNHAKDEPGLRVLDED